MSVRSLNGLSGSTVNVNTLSGGTAISILNQNINLDINKASLASTTAASDQYILEDANGNTKKILYSTLIGSSGSGLTAGEALTITSNVLDVSISKQTAITTSADTDVYLLEDASGNIKKITRANLLAGTISAEWNLVGTTLSTLNSSSNVVIGGTSMSGSEKLRIIGDSVYDGKITITGSNVLEATALTGAYNFNIQNTNVSNNGTLNLMGVNNGGATNLLTIRNDASTPKLTFPSGFWVNNFGTNITNTELLYLSGVSSNIQSQFNTITTNVSNNSSLISTNTGNISTLQNSVSALQTQQSTNTAGIANNSSSISTNTGNINSNALNISTLQSDVSSLQTQQNTNTTAIGNLTSSVNSNTSDVSNIKSKYNFSGTVSNGSLLIGVAASNNYTIGNLTSTGSTITITNNAGNINLEAVASSYTGGDAIGVLGTTISVDISKQSAISSPANDDLYLLEDNLGNIKKITYSNLTNSLLTQINTNAGNITTLTSSVSTNTSNISSNAGNITTLQGNVSGNITDISNLKSRIAYSSTITDGQLLIGNTSSGNFSASTLSSSGGTITITNSGGGINLETSGSSLSAGVAIAINNSNIDLDINKENAFTSPIGNDLLIMYDTTNGATKKITFSNFNSGLQAQITNNDNDISSLTTSVNSNTSNISSLTSSVNSNTSNISSLTTSVNSNTSNISSLTSSVSTNTSNIALNTAAISNLVSTANSTNFGTTASSAITVGNNSQSLALNSASMNCISAGKNFFRSNLSSGLGFQIQGFNSGGVSYTSVIEVHNVASGFPYLNLLMGNGFSINQYTGQSRNLIVDTNGKLNISNDMPITLTAGDGIALNSNSINVDISKQVAINTPANDDVFIVERNTGVINKIAYSDMGIGVVAGNAIAVSSGTTVNVEISKENTITSPASGDLLLLEQASDGVLKNITYGNLISGVDITTATSIGTAATGAITVGNANNQTMNLVGSTININGNAKTKFRSTISTGTGFEVEGENTADNIYYSSLKLDNSNVAGVRPTIEMLGGNGFYGSAGQVLKKDSNNKINWESATSTTPIQYVANTAAVIALTNSSVDGAVAISASPRKLWLKSTVSGSAIWSSIDFIEQTTTLTSASGLINNTGSAQVFTSSPIGISLPNQNDTFNLSIIVEDDYAPVITYPTDTSAFSTTSQTVSSSGTTHTFTAIVNNLLSTNSVPSYNIILTDQNTNTIINLPTITFTLNQPVYGAPSFAASNRSIQSFPTSYTSSDAGNANRSNSLGGIFSDRSYTFYSFNSGSFQNHSQMFGDGRTCAHDSFFGSITWNFTLNSSSALNYLYHASVVASTPANYTDGGVSKGWTQVIFNSTSWQGYNNNANCFRSVDPLTPGNAISTSPGIARGALFVAAKNLF